MTDDQLWRTFNNICHHQVAANVHPLTCGNDSSHPPLFPLVLGGKIVLRCGSCDYLQHYIPDGMLATALSEHGRMAEETARDARRAALSLLQAGGGTTMFRVQHVGGRIDLMVAVKPSC